MSTPTSSGGNIEGVIRDLASTIATAAAPPYTPTQLVKGVVTAFDAVGPPPTVSITLSGDTQVISGVRFLEHYSPVVGDTVAIAKQGSDILILGAYASGVSDWTTATLSTGFTHNGDSQGNVMYRLVWDNGSLKMQWQGAVARSANTTVISALSTSFRPATKRKLSASRGFGGGDITCHVVFNTSGSVVLDAVAITRAETGHTHGLGTSDTQLSGYLAQSGSDLGHAHGLGTSATTAVSMTMSAPDWVSFNGLEYFL